MDKRILLIVEGPHDEKVLMEKIFDRFDRGISYSVLPYRTNIHALMRSLFRDGLDEDVDIVRLLKSSDIPDDRRLGRDETFTDVYLVFDFDPHDPQIDIPMLRDMLRFFDDPTDRGKLFLNYPMMQSYRHLTGEDDGGFGDRAVPADIGRGYKELVDREAWNRLRQVNRLDRGLLKWIICRHLMKMNRIVNGRYEMPSLEEYERIEGWMVLDRQLERIAEDGMVFVLNTSLFFIVDYKPSWFLENNGGDGIQTIPMTNRAS